MCAYILTHIYIADYILSVYVYKLCPLYILAFIKVDTLTLIIFFHAGIFYIANGIIFVVQDNANSCHMCGLGGYTFLDHV